MDQLALLSTLLRLPNHWSVSAVEMDDELRRVRVRLHFAKQQKSLLGKSVARCARCNRKLPAVSAAHTLQLRHLPMGEWQMELLVPDTGSGCTDRVCPGNVEFAEPGTRVTSALAQRLASLLLSGTSLDAASSLLDLGPADVAAVLASRRIPLDALSQRPVAFAGDVSEGYEDEVDVAPEALAAPAPAAAASSSGAAQREQAAEREPEASGRAEDRTADASPAVANAGAPPVEESDPFVLAFEDNADDTTPEEVLDPGTLGTEVEGAGEPEGLPQGGGAFAESGRVAATAASDAVLQQDASTIVRAAATLPPHDEMPRERAVEPLAHGWDPSRFVPIVAVDPPVIAAAPGAPVPEESPDATTVQGEGGPADAQVESPPTAAVNATTTHESAATGGAAQANEAADENWQAAPWPGDELEETSPLDAAIDQEVDALASASVEEEHARATKVGRNAAAAAADATSAPGANEPPADVAAGDEASSAAAMRNAGEAAASSTGPVVPDPAKHDQPRSPVAPSAPMAPTSPSLPPADHPVWAAVLTGKQTLKTDALALQMLLGRLRQYVRNSNDAPQAISAAALVAEKHLLQGGQRYANERAQLLAGLTPPSDKAAVNTAPASRQTSKGRAPEVASTPAPSAAPVAQQITPSVPAVDDPVWRALVSGERALETNSVALKMMLEQIRRSADADPSPATLSAGVRLLHTFFSKTSRRLESEVAQLTRATTSAPSPREEAAPSVEQQPARRTTPKTPPLSRRDDLAAARVPAETSPAWRALLNGSIVATENDPGLAMLIEKVRRVTRQGQDSQEVMAAAGRVLRRYLVRYADRHADLLDQLATLQAQPTDTAPKTAKARAWLGGNRGGGATRTSEVPSPGDPVWRRLVLGEISLQTDVFALRMMLERIRGSVARDPSESNVRTAAGQLREYFVKHERVHRAELRRLRVA